MRAEWLQAGYQRLGLGLYIGRQIVELHGGQIRAEFPDDRGSRFVVTLPLHAPESRGGPSGR